MQLAFTISAKIELMNLSRTEKTFLPLFLHFIIINCITFEQEQQKQQNRWTKASPCLTHEEVCREAQKTYKEGAYRNQ